MRTWYPRRTLNRIAAPGVSPICPVCNGAGERKDEKTGKMRGCVACKGEGIIIDNKLK